MVTDVVAPSAPVYLDCAASMPMFAEVADAMAPFLSGWAANPSGAHQLSRAARHAIEDARDDIAAHCGVSPHDLVFTSGATEANHLCINGRYGVAPGRVVCSAIEHPAVLEPVVALGGTVTPVHSNGVINLDSLTDMLDDSVTLVSVMGQNNEIGTFQPLERIAHIVSEYAPNAVVHCDATQAVAWTPIDALLAHVHLGSLSAHKFGGPTGVGAAIIKSPTTIAPQFVGGGQEQTRRSGTLNTASIVGMAEAFREITCRRVEQRENVRSLRDRLVAGVLGAGNAIATAEPDGSTPLPLVISAGTAHVCFADVISEELLFLLDADGICASAASACASGAQQRSHVAEALDVDPRFAMGSIRFTLSYETTVEDIDYTIQQTLNHVGSLRSKRKNS